MVDGLAIVFLVNLEHIMGSTFGGICGLVLKLFKTNSHIYSLLYLFLEQKLVWYWNLDLNPISLYVEANIESEIIQILFFMFLLIQC